MSYLLLGLICCFCLSAAAQVSIERLTTLEKQSTMLNIAELEVCGDLAFSASWDQGLYVYDVSDEENPRIIHNLRSVASQNLQHTFAIEIKDQTIYIADSGVGIIVGDISNPTNIIAQPPLRVPGQAVNIQLKDNLLFVAAESAGLVIVDVSQKPLTTNSIIGRYQTTGWVEDVDVIGNIAFVADSDYGLQIIDVSNPAAPVLLKRYLSQFGSVSTIDVVGHLIYMVGSLNAALLEIVDVSDPANPKPAGFCPAPSPRFSQGSSQIEIRNQLAYIADGVEGLEIVDISDPANPILLDQTLESFWGGFCFTDDRIWVTYNTHLFACDLTNPAAPQRLGSGLNSHRRFTTGFIVDKHLLYAVNQFYDLQIFDLSDPANPKPAGGFRSPYMIERPIVDWPHLYAWGEAGPYILDISNPARIRPVNEVISNNLFMSGFLRYLEITNHQLTAYSSQKGLVVLDLLNPLQPETLLAGYTNFPMVAGQRHGDLLYGITTKSNLIVLDLSVPASPVLLGQTSEPVIGAGISLYGDHAYVWGWYNNFSTHPATLKIIDIHDPTQPRLLGEHPALARHMQIVGHTAYLASDTNGLVVLDLTNPASPAYVTNYTAETVTGLFAYDNLVLTVDSNLKKNLNILETFGLNQSTPSILPGSFGLTAGQAQFDFRSGLPSAYEIESSTDFVNWTPAGSVTATNTRTRFSKPATNGLEFYRVRAP